MKQCYQAVSDVEDDVDGVQAVADVLPERENHNHRLSVRPWQVIVVVTLEIITHQLKKILLPGQHI